MGQHEVCDFVLLLLACAVSGEASLAVFFQSVSPVKHLLMAVWGRARCPVASTLSRFFEAVEDGAQALQRQLFEHNLLQQSYPSLQMEDSMIVEAIGTGCLISMGHMRQPATAPYPPLKPNQKPRIGMRTGDYAYELVLTSIPVHALNAVDMSYVYLWCMSKGEERAYPAG